MKNYIRQGQKLPLYGIGPTLIAGMAALTLIGILLAPNALKSGAVPGAWAIAFRTAGVLLIIAGAALWLVGAVGSGMDESIAENRLKTDGIYACVRNPMYSGWWLVFAGIALMLRNAFLLLIPLSNWGIMTVVLRSTEEKWLRHLYGQAYDDYCHRVNRCLPWFPRKGA